MVKPIGVLDDIVVSVAWWEYPLKFMVIESKDPSKGHPIILGRPWLATANAFIGCRDGEMTISNGLSTQTYFIPPSTTNNWKIMVVKLFFWGWRLRWPPPPSWFILGTLGADHWECIKLVCLFDNLYRFPSVLCSTRSDFWRWVSREYGSLNVYRNTLCLHNWRAYMTIYHTLWGWPWKISTYKRRIKWKPTSTAA